MNLTLVTPGVYTECGQLRARDVKIDPGFLAAELDAIQVVLATNGMISAKAESGPVKA